LKEDQLYRRIIALIFFVAFLAQTFSMTFVIADYFANTSKYAKNCVNKAKPKLHCNGKCQMMKKLQQEEKKDQESPERKSESKIEIILFAKSFYANTISPFKIRTKSQKILPSSDGKSTDRSFDIFHPPQHLFYT
jgi:hypothetical protein